MVPPDLTGRLEFGARARRLSEAIVRSREPVARRPVARIRLDPHLAGRQDLAQFARHPIVIVRGDEEAFPLAGEELVTAIEQVLRGHVYRTSPMVTQVMERMASPVETGVELTPRQREVLRLIVEGRRKERNCSRSQPLHAHRRVVQITR